MTGGKNPSVFASRFNAIRSCSTVWSILVLVECLTLSEVFNSNKQILSFSRCPAVSNGYKVTGFRLARFGRKYIYYSCTEKNISEQNDACCDYNLLHLQECTGRLSYIYFDRLLPLWHNM